MAYAPLPESQYIDYEHNVGPYVGTDKIAVNDTQSTAIPTALAAQLIAEGESLAILDLSPYYVTVPTLLTTSGEDWTHLPQATYNSLYYMFVTQAAMKLIGNFIARNTDQEKTSLSYFQNFYASEYNKYLNRLIEKLPNGSYRYQFNGLMPLATGISRSPQVYAIPGSFGANSYADRQVTDPSKNFSSLWPNGRQNN